MPGWVDDVCPALSANELAWLATLPDVESRLVFTERGRDKISYRLETGPFEEAELEALPDKIHPRLAHRRPDGKFRCARRQRWTAS